MATPWRYSVTWKHATTGEQKRVVVTLSEAERFDALRHWSMRGDQGPGGPCGPIVNGYAMRRASANLDADWIGDVPKIEPIIFSVIQ